MLTKRFCVGVTQPVSNYCEYLIQWGTGPQVGCVRCGPWSYEILALYLSMYVKRYLKFVELRSPWVLTKGGGERGSRGLIIFYVFPSLVEKSVKLRRIHHVMCSKLDKKYVYTRFVLPALMLLLQQTRLFKKKSVTIIGGINFRKYEYVE